MGHNTARGAAAGSIGIVDEDLPVEVGANDMSDWAYEKQQEESNEGAGDERREMQAAECKGAV